MKGRPNKTGLKWERQKEYRKRHPARVKKSQKICTLKVKYGLSIEDYESLLKDQEGKCSICKNIAVLHVDHCHKTNKVRGLLCMNCNVGIGNFRDDVKLLKRAMEYLT